MSDTINQTTETLIQAETFLGLNNENYLDDDNEWYQDNLDIVVPLIIIAAGLFQYILRKWILPVSDDVISKLEDQFPSQGLIYQHEFGAFLMIVGFILLVFFNVFKYI
ncbi:MAG: hypothetical protein OQK98_11575 [Gammaproteobacteria bacterium]|nr:hypothetical protein [Gammaproteobacteria bacterium]